jgi:CRISPR-associated endonuclease Cas2
MSLEKELSQEIRMTALRKAILSTVQVAGVITIAVMAPNVLSLVGKIQKRKNERLHSAVTRLAQKGLLHVGHDGIRLTEKGERYMQKETLVIPRPRRWDKKWRLVIFDIPEKRRALRQLLRHKLISIGFVRLQDSAWVYPFDCEELLILLKTDYRLGKEVLYIIANKIERVSEIRKQFGI